MNQQTVSLASDKDKLQQNTFWETIHRKTPAENQQGDKICVCVCCTANCMLTNLLIFWHYVYLHAVFAHCAYSVHRSGCHCVHTYSVSNLILYQPPLYLYVFICSLYEFIMRVKFSKWIRIGNCFPKKKKTVVWK